MLTRMRYPPFELRVRVRPQPWALLNLPPSAPIGSLLSPPLPSSFCFIQPFCFTLSSWGTWGRAVDLRPGSHTSTRSSSDPFPILKAGTFSSSIENKLFCYICPAVRDVEASITHMVYGGFTVYDMQLEDHKKISTHHTPHTTHIPRDDADELVCESVRRFFKSLSARGGCSVSWVMGGVFYG